MEVIFTNDQWYPIKIDNTYGTGDIPSEVLDDDKEWNEFIDNLQKARQTYLRSKKEDRR